MTTSHSTTSTARTAYGLTVYEISPDGLRSLVGDGETRYWIDSAALDAQATTWGDDDERTAAAYAAWCRDAHAEEA